MDSVASGEITGRTTTRVRYPETDRMGVAHHTHFLVWFELGRTELMRDRGCAYGDLEEKEGIFFPVVEAGAKYRTPARYDEVLDITTRLVDARGARLRFEYTISRATDGAPVATGFTEHASIGKSGRPVRLPTSVQGLLGNRRSA
jgi:acyl-CoA thioester hydrolase